MKFTNCLNCNKPLSSKYCECKYPSKIIGNIYVFKYGGGLYKMDKNPTRIYKVSSTKTDLIFEGRIDIEFFDQVEKIIKYAHEY